MGSNSTLKPRRARDRPVVYPAMNKRKALPSTANTITAKCMQNEVMPQRLPRHKGEGGHRLSPQPLIGSRDYTPLTYAVLHIVVQGSDACSNNI